MENLDAYKKIHFIGVGGVSMRALAEYSLTFAGVSGSDRVDSIYLDRLRQKGAKVYEGSDPKTAAQADLVVYTAAIEEDDPEYLAAKHAGKPLLERCVYLQMAAKTCGRALAVAGTHGKTSTTGFIAHIFKSARQKFVAHVGGEIVDLGGNFLDLGRDWFVTEACEYRQSFLSLTPDIALITNIEYDHPDTYVNYDAVKSAFLQFSKQAKVTIAEETCFAKDEADVIRYGYREDNDYVIKNVASDRSKFRYDLYHHGALFDSYELNIYGRYSVLNSAAAAIAAHTAGIAKPVIKEAVRSFNGAKRRFECRGRMDSGARVISDYAHHPSEIKNAIATAKGLAEGKILVAFEPHTYSRTKNLLQDFKSCFCGADALMVLPTYAARETPDAGMRAEEFCEELAEGGQNCLFLPDYKKAADHIREAAAKNDIVMVVGAGNIDALADLLTDSPRWF